MNLKCTLQGGNFYQEEKQKGKGHLSLALAISPGGRNLPQNQAEYNLDTNSFITSKMEAIGFLFSSNYVCVHVCVHLCVCV